MERVLTENERIRRAEEIAYRRKYPNEKWILRKKFLKHILVVK